MTAMTARSSSRRAAALRSQLSQRELSVLASLEALRLMTTAQVRRLHLAGESTASNTRLAQYTLKRLHQLKLVVRLSRVIGGTRAGSAGVVYGISSLGIAVLSGHTTTRRRRVWDAKPYFQDHMLAVSELSVGLHEYVRRHPEIELLATHTEPNCWRRFSGVGGELVVLKPDAYVELAAGDLVLSAFIEVDLGTESLPTILEKCRRYVAYWRSGLEQQRLGVYPRVVWLVPEQRRKTNIERVISGLTEEEAGLFMVALLRDGPAVLARLLHEAEGRSGKAEPRAPP